MEVPEPEFCTTKEGMILCIYLSLKLWDKFLTHVLTSLMVLRRVVNFLVRSDFYLFFRIEW